MPLISTTSTSLTIAEYCRQLVRKEIVVNRDYQRSDKVWPPAARSFLIETILLGYPLPKLSLYQITDVVSRETVKEIVDGQQRSQTILDYYNGKLRLLRSIELEEAAGRLYEELPSEFQHRFLDYALQIDLFTAATSEQIREIFRRMNSYTVPLNPEEHRHATFQGPFKWFIYEQARAFDQVMLDMGVFTEKALVRMADAKLYSEVVHALVFGISTTSKSKLDSLYRRFDREFPHEHEFGSRLSNALDFLLEVPEIHNGPLMKHYMMYSLLLAVMHVNNPVETLDALYTFRMPFRPNREIIAANLTALADAVETEDENSRFGPFVNASASRTNVKDQREARFVWFCEALQPNVL